MNTTEEKLQFFEQYVHEKNRKRIQWGIRVLMIGPLVFVALMMIMQSNKNIYLLLWIISLFVIAAYLISVEYMDFQMQKKLRDIGVPGLQQTSFREKSSESTKLLIDENMIPKGFLALEKLENDIIEGNLKEINNRNLDTDTDSGCKDTKNSPSSTLESIEVVVRENSEYVHQTVEEPKRDIPPMQIKIEPQEMTLGKQQGKIENTVIQEKQNETDITEGMSDLQKADYILQQAIKAKVEAEVRARMEREMKDKMSAYIDTEVENLSKIISEQIIGDK